MVIREIRGKEKNYFIVNPAAKLPGILLIKKDLSYNVYIENGGIIFIADLIQFKDPQPSDSVFTPVLLRVIQTPPIKDNMFLQ